MPARAALQPWHRDLQLSFQPTHRWKLFSAQLLSMLQTKRKQLAVKEFSEHTNKGVCQSRVSVPAVPLEWWPWHPLRTASAAEHARLPHRSIVKGKMYSASILQLLFCFTVFKYSALHVCATRSQRICSPLARESAWQRPAVFSPLFNLVFFSFVILKLYLCKTDWTKHFWSHSCRFHFGIDFKSQCFDFFTGHFNEFFITVFIILYNCLAAPYSFRAWCFNHCNDLHIIYMQTGSDKHSTCNTGAKPSNFGLEPNSTWSPKCTATFS